MSPYKRASILVLVTVPLLVAFVELAGRENVVGVIIVAATILLTWGGAVLTRCPKCGRSVLHHVFRAGTPWPRKICDDCGYDLTKS